MKKKMNKKLHNFSQFSGKLQYNLFVADQITAFLWDETSSKIMMFIAKCNQKTEDENNY